MLNSPLCSLGVKRCNLGEGSVAEANNILSYYLLGLRLIAAGLSQ